MKDISFNIADEYKSTLRHYLNGGGEKALKAAYELGRKAIGSEVGSIEVMHIHQKVLQEILRTARSLDEVIRLSEAALLFFTEVLSPYEMTFLGYRDALNTVRESEERYRKLIDTAKDVIYTLSSDGLIKSLNPVFETITGWSRAEWVGKPFVPLVHPEDLSFALAMHQRLMSGEMPLVFELRIRTKAGEYLVGEFTTTPEYREERVVGTFGIARDITERKHATEKLKALAKRVVDAQEEERKRLSRELHDDLCQWLSGMKLSFGMLEEKFSNDKSFQTTIRRLKRQINDRIVEVRRMSTNLRPSALDDFGLPIALTRLCEEVKKLHSLDVSFATTNLSNKRYPTEIEIALYRIAQEALSNIGKHARASTASVLLSHSDNALILEVQDNGIGFDQNRVESRKPLEGLGLISMRERAELQWGTFHIESLQGKGTYIKVEIPLT